MSAVFADIYERYRALCRETGPGLLPRLARLLTELHGEILRLPEGDADEYGEAVLPDYHNVYAHVAAAFPEIGMYHACLNPLSVSETPKIGTGDAIDDLTDIYLDLHEGYVVWNKGYSREAVWRWKFGFRHHWGAHLVAVQAVLYTEMHA